MLYHFSIFAAEIRHSQQSHLVIISSSWRYYATQFRLYYGITHGCRSINDCWCPSCYIFGSVWQNILAGSWWTIIYRAEDSLSGLAKSSNQLLRNILQAWAFGKISNAIERYKLCLVWCKSRCIFTITFLITDSCFIVLIYIFTQYDMLKGVKSLVI